MGILNRIKTYRSRRELALAWQELAAKGRKQRKQARARTSSAPRKIQPHYTIIHKIVSNLVETTLEKAGTPHPRSWQAAASPPKVGLGWATIRFDGVKVRSSKSSDGTVVRTLNEGHRVLVAEVCTKSVRIEIPNCGWIKLQKHSEPVLHQEAYEVRQPGEASATTQLVTSVLERLGAGREKPAEERLKHIFAVQVLISCCIMHTWRLLSFFSLHVSFRALHLEVPIAIGSPHFITSADLVPI